MRQAFYITQMTFCAFVMILAIPTGIFGLPLIGFVMVAMGGVGFVGGKLDYEMWKARKRLTQAKEGR